MEPILQVKNISKTFPGVKALSDVSADFYPGEVHTLVGENGAGKSTLIKIISGVYTPDPGGKIIFEGKDMNFTEPGQAIDAGIAVIHQELSEPPTLPPAFCPLERNTYSLFLLLDKLA